MSNRRHEQPSEPAWRRPGWPHVSEQSPAVQRAAWRRTYRVVRAPTLFLRGRAFRVITSEDAPMDDPATRRFWLVIDLVLWLCATAAVVALVVWLAAR